MALLAYLVMVAMLMTSVFVGYEWVATSSSPRVAVYNSAPTKVAKQAKLAAAAKARLASSSPSGAPGQKLNISEAEHALRNSQPVAAVVASSKEGQPEDRQAAQAYRKRAKVALRRFNGQTSQAALGYAAAREFTSFAAFDHVHQ
jgi:hypothetical protein